MQIQSCRHLRTLAAISCILRRHGQTWNSDRGKQWPTRSQSLIFLVEGAEYAPVSARGALVGDVLEMAGKGVASPLELATWMLQFITGSRLVGGTLKRFGIKCRRPSVYLAPLSCSPQVSPLLQLKARPPTSKRIMTLSRASPYRGGLGASPQCLFESTTNTFHLQNFYGCYFKVNNRHLICA